MTGAGVQTQVRLCPTLLRTRKANDTTDEFGHPATKSGNARRQQNVNEPNMRARLESLKLNDMRLLQYIPYARRRVVEVLPSAADDGKAAHFSDLCCLVTVPSPWVKAEGWRRMPLGNNDQPSDEAAYDMEDVSPLECEVATIDDPDRINVWVERSVLGNDSSGQSLIGIALRGRWGLFGSAKDAEAQWWGFRSKDCEQAAVQIPSPRLLTVNRCFARSMVRRRGARPRTGQGRVGMTLWGLERRIPSINVRMQAVQPLQFD